MCVFACLNSFTGHFKIPWVKQIRILRFILRKAVPQVFADFALRFGMRVIKQ